MSSLIVASIVFACTLGGALLGMFLRTLLPADHFSTESKDVMKLGAGLIATTAALVLGLLTASAKGTFDTQKSEIQQSAANVVMLDRVLANYGPETKEGRDLLRRAMAARIELTWPDDRSKIGKLDAPEMAAGAEAIEDRIRGLTPRDDGQRYLQSKAMQICGELMKARWLVLDRASGSSIPTPFLVVVVFWLAVVFVTFGLLAPPNATVAVVLAFAAMSVAGAIFLILEMDRPFQGLLKISGDPLRYALSQLGR